MSVIFKLFIETKTLPKKYALHIGILIALVFFGLSVSVASAATSCSWSEAVLAGHACDYNACSSYPCLADGSIDPSYICNGSQIPVNCPAGGNGAYTRNTCTCTVTASPCGSYSGTDGARSTGNCTFMLTPGVTSSGNSYTTTSLVSPTPAGYTGSDTWSCSDGIWSPGSWTCTAPACVSYSGTSCSATSSANACGSTNTNYGTYSCAGSCSASTPGVPANPWWYNTSCSATNTCGGTNWGTYNCAGSCSVGAPANPWYYNTACTGPTSSPNACGQTNPGGAGTYNCGGTCSGATGSTPANPWYYNTSCSATNTCGGTNWGTYNCAGSCSVGAPANPWYYNTACNTWNSCGTNYNSGVYNCGGSCSAGAPANPWYYGVGCTSAPNACGGTNGGIYDCGGTCSASTPANPAYYGTACTSAANTCGQTSAGTKNCSNVCSATTPANPSYYGTACTSAPNTCGGTTSGTKNCSNVCSATTPANPWYYGVACTSAANTCGGTTSGTYDCAGTCSAVTPANPSYYGTACTSAPNTCGGTTSGTKNCSNVCSAVTPANPSYYGTACTSAPNTCGGTTSGTKNCSNVCTAVTPSNPAYYGTACTSAANTCGGTNAGTKDCSNVCTASVPANPWYYGVACTSAANGCGQVNTGTYNCSYVCSAVAPPNSTCPDPALAFSASPTIVAPNATSTLSWTPMNAVSCTASNGWSGSVASSGSNTSVQTIPSTKTFSLECKNSANVSTGVRSVTVTVPASPTLTFSASPTVVAPNASSTLSWTPTGATSCWASNGWSGWVSSTGGSSVQSIPSTKTFALECWNSVGVSSRVQSITVTVPASPTLTFSASPTVVAPNASSTLSWTSANADWCWASGGWSGWVSSTGGSSVQSIPATKTFSLKCGYSVTGVETAVQSVTVTVPPSPTLSFSASSTIVAPNATSTLSWTTTGAVSCWASNGWSGWQTIPNGSSVQSIPSTKSFSLECWNSVGVSSGVQSITVTVPAAPTLVFSTSSPTVMPGGTITLSWTPANTDWCWASGHWSGWVSGTGGSSLQTINTNKSFSLQCGYSVTGVTTAIQTVTVTMLPPTVGLTINGSTGPIGGTLGDTLLIAWVTSPDATSCTTISGPGFTGTWPGSGSKSIPAQTGDYRIQCTGPGGTTASNIVRVALSCTPFWNSWSGCNKSCGTGQNTHTGISNTCENISETKNCNITPCGGYNWKEVAP